MSFRSFPFFAVAAVIPQTVTLTSSQTWPVPRNFHTITVTCNNGVAGGAGLAGAAGTPGGAGADNGTGNATGGAAGQPGSAGSAGTPGSPSTFKGAGSAVYTRGTLAANSSAAVIVGPGGPGGAGGAGGAGGGGGGGAGGTLIGLNIPGGWGNPEFEDVEVGPAGAQGGYNQWGNAGNWPDTVASNTYPVIPTGYPPGVGADPLSYGLKSSGDPPTLDPSAYDIYWYPAAGGPPGSPGGAGAAGAAGAPGSVTITVA